MAEQKCVLVRKEVFDETLATAPTKGKHLLEPLKSIASENKLPLMGILEDTEVTNEAEIHHHEGDLWLCLEGEVEFIYGGELIEPWFKKLPDGSEDRREVKAKEIKNGTREILKPGDWLWIPAGRPHVHNKLDGYARLVIIKIPKV